ncbi:uncharacterized protein LOC127107288 [Lathyrus oleraceus]|uniref:uncharacterized protein LOC127107288 n=1 Tax=Pisum sativum TaxID=3888 RepID=UPI0021D3AA9E|nr:uncharacterized protein LOC127107288 [Pisum sativum]
MDTTIAQQSATTVQQAETSGQQAAIRAQREALRDQREEVVAAARELTDFNHQNPPKFKGEHDSEKADLWIQEIDFFFEMLHYTNAKKVEYATFLLMAKDESWWRGAKQLMESKNEALNWVTFKQKFMDKYFPSSARSEKEAQFLRLYQGNMTIFEYADKFDSLAKYFRYFRDHVDENYKCERFEQGLRYEIKESVEPLEIRQFQGHQDRNNRGKQQQPYTRPQKSGRDQLQTQFKGGQRPQNSSSIRCYNCNKEGHVSTQCPERVRVCYLCQRPGHFARDCQAPRRDHVPYTNNNNDAIRSTAKGRAYHIGGKEASNASGLI